MTPLSTSQAAAIAKVNPATVCRWCDGGGLRHTTTALGHRVILQTDLETFLEARETERRKRQEHNDRQKMKRIERAIAIIEDPAHEALLRRIRAKGAGG